MSANFVERWFSRVSERTGVAPRRAAIYGLVFLAAGLLIFVLFAASTHAGQTTTFVLDPSGETDAIPVPALAFPTSGALYLFVLACAFIGGWQVRKMRPTAVLVATP